MHKKIILSTIVKYRIVKYRIVKSNEALSAEFEIK